MNLASSIAIGILAGFLPRLVYSMVRIDWPESYVYDKGPLERLQLRNLRSYLAFKTVPLLLFVFLGVSTCVQLGLPPLACAVSSGLIFIAMTDVRALINAYRSHDTRSGMLTVFYLGNVVFSALVAAMGYFAGIHGVFLAPTPKELVAAAWTALLVAVLAFGLRSAISSNKLSVSDKTSLARRDMRDSVWRQVDSIAHEHGVDPDLAKAIIVAEVLQRPRWFRAAERLVGRFRKFGTYGVAQMRSARPISDIESVVLLCESLPPWEMATEPWERFDQYQEVVSKRGASSGYVSEVFSIYIDLVHYQS